MYDRTWLKTETKRLPEALDRELERRLGMELEKKCDSCKYASMSGAHYPCRDCNKLKYINADKPNSYWEPMDNEELEKKISRELEQPADPFKTQIGGSHYKDFAIQPAEFITKNKLSFLEGCVVKRMCRKKGNRLEDLKKAKHEIDLIIELEGLCPKT